MLDGFGDDTPVEQDRLEHVDGADRTVFRELGVDPDSVHALTSLFSKSQEYGVDRAFPYLSVGD